jgi:hypothetical protein
MNNFVIRSQLEKETSQNKWLKKISEEIFECCSTEHIAKWLTVMTLSLLLKATKRGLQKPLRLIYLFKHCEKQRSTDEVVTL